MATGINDTFRQVGVAVGIAAWGALFLARGEDRIVELAPGTPFAQGERPRELIEATASGKTQRSPQCRGRPSRPSRTPPARDS